MSALPHPGPLPLGEGEPLAVSEGTLRRIGGKVLPNARYHLRRFPLPAGEGKGEGERSNQVCG